MSEARDKKPRGATIVSSVLDSFQQRQDRVFGAESLDTLPMIVYCRERRPLVTVVTSWDIFLQNVEPGMSIAQYVRIIDM